MRYTSKLFISLGVLVATSATSVSAQIEFRRPSGVKDRIVTQPAKETYQPPVRSAQTAEESNNSLAMGLRDFIVDPDENSAVIKFKAPAGSAPVVEIGTELPISGPGGKLEFPSRLQFVQAEVATEKNALQQINFNANLTGLDRGTRYYYLVSTSDATLQTRGRFATLKRQTNVTVVFTEISVLRGEVDVFDFWVNSKHLGWIGQTENDKQLDWDSESGSHSINKSIEITDVPDVLELQTNGCEDTMTFFEQNGCGGNFYDHTSQHKTPIGDRAVNLNIAIQAINLRDIPGKNVRQEFQIESQQNKVNLAFCVKGYFVITRE